MTLPKNKKFSLIDPVTKATPITFSKAPRIRSLSNQRVGIIDDSKPNAKELLEEIVALINQDYGVANVSYHRKPSASKPANTDIIAELARNCDYVIVGIGD